MNEMTRTGRLTGWVFTIAMTLMVGIVLFFQHWDYAYKIAVRWSNPVCFLAGILGSFLLFLLAMALSGHIRSKKLRYTCMGVLSFLVGCLTFFSAGHYAFTPGWDVAMMCENAQVMMWGGDAELMSDYFSRYPNNILLTWLLAMSFRLSDVLGIPGGQRYFVGLGIQSLGFGLSAFLVYVCADKLTGGKHPAVPLWSWFVMLIMVCASPWVAVMYSDSASLIFIMIEVWLYMKARENGKLCALWAGLLCFTGITAYHIKPQGSIFLIAAVGMTLLTAGKRAFRKENIKKTGAVVLAGLIGVGLAAGCYRLVVRDTGFDINEDRSFGPAHYLMMGLNTEESGTYFDDDVGFSISFSDQSERTRADLERAWERVQAMGVGGLLQQAVRKTLVNYSDGTFTWEKEGNFYAYDTYYFPWCSQWAYEHIPNFYIGEEYTTMVDWSCSWIFRLIEQCAWMAVLFLCIFAFSRRADPRTATVLLGLLGVILFGLLFEARARYVFCHAPVYILAAGLGVHHLSELWKNSVRPALMRRK